MDCVNKLFTSQLLEKLLFYYLDILDRRKEAGMNKYKRERQNKTLEEKRKRNAAIIN